MNAEEFTKEIRYNLQTREKAWDVICVLLRAEPDKNARAVMVQKYIAEGGPVPDSRGDIVRNLLK